MLSLMFRAGLMVKTLPIAVTKKYPAALRWSLYLATGCLVAIYLRTPAASGGNITNLNLENFRLIQSVFLLVVLGPVFYRGLGMGMNPIASEIRLLRGGTLSRSSKAVRA
jgi:hypothetical protein